MSSAANEIQLRTNRNVIKFVGDYLGPAVLLIFGGVLWYFKAKENLFSFTAWGLLDFLTGWVLLKSADPKENESAPLPLAYSAICVFVVIVIAKNAEFLWTWVETACVIGMVAGLVFWKKLKNTQFGVISFCSALCIASVPIVVGTYHDPQPWEWWLWVGTGTSASIGFYFSFPWRGDLRMMWNTITAWLFVAVGTIIPLIILVLTFRPFF